MEDLEYFDAVLPTLLHSVDIWWFYVKSILENLRVLRLPILPIYGLKIVLIW